MLAGQIVAVRWVVAVGTVGPWVCRTATYWFWPHRKQKQKQKVPVQTIGWHQSTFPPAHVGGPQISIACLIKESVYIQCASATCPRRCCCYNFRGRSVRYEPAGTMLRVVSRTYCASVDCACVCAFCMTVLTRHPLQDRAEQLASRYARGSTHLHCAANQRQPEIMKPQVQCFGCRQLPACGLVAVHNEGTLQPSMHCSATPSHHTGGERKCQISRGVCTLPIAKTPTGEAYELDLHLPFRHFLHTCVYAHQCSQTRACDSARQPPSPTANMWQAELG